MKASSIWVTGLTGLALLAAGAAGKAYGQQSGDAQSPAPQSEENQKAATDPNPANQPGVASNLLVQAQQTLDTFKQKDPSLEGFFRDSAGYVVFPKVGEGALIVGGARGQGVVYQNGQPVGTATVTKGTFGAQIGGQSYAELIFFETPQALADFKSSNLELSADVSAVAAAEGAARTARYSHGVAVFTTSRQGAMAQAAVGGQKFKYQPLAVGGSSTPGGGGSSDEGGNPPK